MDHYLIKLIHPSPRPKNKVLSETFGKLDNVLIILSGNSGLFCENCMSPYTVIEKDPLCNIFFTTFQKNCDVGGNCGNAFSVLKFEISYVFSYFLSP